MKELSLIFAFCGALLFCIFLTSLDSGSTEEVQQTSLVEEDMHATGQTEYCF